MKIGILLFEQWHQRGPAGSSKIRGHWLVKYWKEAEIFKQGANYDAVIFQKCYWVDFAKAFNGVKILDVCDPDWLDAMPIVEMIDLCDAVTTSTEALRDEIKKFTDKPVIFIPDRQDLEFHNVKKVHEGQAKKVIWFGYAHNTNVLDKTIGFIKKLGLQLTVLSNGRPPYTKADRNIKYNWDNPEFDFNKIILDNDIVLLPENNSFRGRFKSDNKTYTAWALGMPVAKTPDDIKRFLDPIERSKEAELRFNEVKEKYDVRQSVEEFKKLINQIQEGKNKK
jgi:hypothetical protein